MSVPIASFPMPALLPKELSYCGKATSEESLLSMLTENPPNFILFFEHACADETWSEQHSTFMQGAMEWMTDQVFEDQLFSQFGKRAAKAIQEHYPVLDPLIPLNIEFKLRDGSMLVNSLMFSAGSSFFKDALRRECLDKNKKTLNLDVPTYLFRSIAEHLNTGKMAYLWKQNQHEVIDVLRVAGAWGLADIVKDCEDSLRRYITKENAVEMLMTAHQESWEQFKQACLDFINSSEEGFRLLSSRAEELTFEFLEFNDTSLAYFEALRQLITELVCSGNLTQDPQFSGVVRQCPIVRALNISGSDAFSEYLLDIPRDLQSINLAQCPWLNHQTLKKLAEICPNLKKMILASNVQLNFAAWGELLRFRGLTTLDLTRCHHISDEDFLVILRACRSVTELILDECKKISDKGYFRLAKEMPRLLTLELSRCSITDLALVEIATRCHNLTSINLMRCENITEKGLAGLAKHAHLLKEVNLTRCNIPRSAIDELKAFKPYLNVISSESY